MNALEKLSLISASVGVTLPDEVLPEANCTECKYEVDQDNQGHCYMFRELPGSHCAQFKEKHTKSSSGHE